MVLMSLPLLAAVLEAGTAIGGNDSGVKGRVVPCGIVLERAAPCAVDGKAAVVTVGKGRQVVRRVKCDAHGTFRVRLDAGRYWLQARAGATRGARVGATVTGDHWTTVTLIAGRVAPPSAR